MNTKHITCEINDHIAVVTYSRPPVNSMSAETYTEMATVFGALKDEQKVRCIVLRTEGRGFIGGNDLNEVEAHTVENHSAYQDIVGGAVMAVKEAAVPVIASVQGYAIGSGMLLALACDLVVCSERAWFTLPEVSLGIIAGASFAMNDLPQKILYQMCLTGERMYAQDMKSYGAVNYVVKPEELADKTAEIAKKLASLPPMTTKLFKKCTAGSYDHQSEKNFHRETVYTDLLLGSAERAECMEAFHEKRPAKF